MEGNAKNQIKQNNSSDKTQFLTENKAEISKRKYSSTQTEENLILKNQFHDLQQSEKQSIEEFDNGQSERIKSHH
jgi:hypothetical protein